MSHRPWLSALLPLCVLASTACGGSEATNAGAAGDGDPASAGSASSGARNNAGEAGSAAGGAAIGGRGGMANAGGGGSGAFSGTGGNKGSGVELGYCPGQVPPQGYAACATDADCSGSTPLCRDEQYSGAARCGACYAPAMPCTDDAACANGICGPFTNPCACSAGMSECTAACTATSCAYDEQCASSGHCVPKSCTAGWTCPMNDRCAATGATGADPHGCAPVPCAEGYTCPSGSACSADASASRDPHGCVAIHCSQSSGSVCPVNWQCLASLPGSGCAIRKCNTSSDCDCGTCRQGICGNRPGICLPFPPP
jgi:hypothetical protein